MAEDSNLQGDSKKEISINLSFLKKINWTFVLLAIFIIFGIYLRLYHVDFPAIGYHNMKENEYVDQAVFFTEEGNFLHKQAFAFSGFDEQTGYHEEYGQAPLVPYMLFILWKIFGESLTVGRLLMIAFFMGAVLLTYFVTMQLTKNKYISLVSSGLMSIMPLGIYFGRNIQPEPPALFFSLLSLLFYLKWIDSDKADKNYKNIFLATLFLGIAGLFKYTFLIFAVPMLVVFPIKKFIGEIAHKNKKTIKEFLYAIYGFIPFVLGVIVYEFLTIVNPANRNYDFEFLRILTPEYWATRWDAVYHFLLDNYTLWFVFIALAGLFFACSKYKTNFGKFMIGYAVAIPMYIAAISSKFAGHSYYQMPFLPLICILSAYAFFVAGSILKSATNNKFAIYLPLILILIAAPSMQAANDRVFGTVFYGQDFLGEYLKTRLAPDERFTALTHAQDLATCSYAKHRCGFVGTLEEFKHKEQVFNLRYFYVGTQFFNDLLNSQDPLWQYIRANYGIDLVGLMQYNGQLSPVHFILKKGAKFSLTDVDNKQPVLAKTYDSKQGDVPYYYIQVIRP